MACEYCLNNDGTWSEDTCIANCEHSGDYPDDCDLIDGEIEVLVEDE